MYWEFNAEWSPFRGDAIAGGLTEEQQRVNTISSARLDLPSPVYRFVSFHKALTRRALRRNREAVVLRLFTPLLFVFFVGCSAAASNSATGYSFVTLSKGSQSGVRERKLVVIKNENDWKALWNSHASLLLPPKEPPLVDFQTEMIVAVFSGEKPTGGYSIEITGIQKDSAKHVVQVFVRESKPPAGAIVVQALSQPYHIVKLTRVELPVTFVFQ